MGNEGIRIDVQVYRIMGRREIRLQGFSLKLPGGLYREFRQYMDSLHRKLSELAEQQSARLDDSAINIISYGDTVMDGVVLRDEVESVESEDALASEIRLGPDKSEGKVQGEHPARRNDTSSSGEKCTDSHTQVFLRRGALERAQLHAKQNLSKEVGGVLLGKFLDCADGKKVVLILGIVQALEAIGHTTSLEFTDKAWATIWRAIDNDPVYGDDKMWSIVGWYHTHPSFGIFLSPLDIFIHETYFINPGHVALVVDPVRDQWGCFGWDRQRANIPECNRVFVCDDETLLNWLTEKTPVHLSALPPVEIGADPLATRDEHPEESQEAVSETSPQGNGKKIDDRRTPCASEGEILPDDTGRDSATVLVVPGVDNDGNVSGEGDAEGVDCAPEDSRQGSASLTPDSGEASHGSC